MRICQSSVKHDLTVAIRGKSCNKSFITHFEEKEEEEEEILCQLCDQKVFFAPLQPFL